MLRKPFTAALLAVAASASQSKNMIPEFDVHVAPHTGYVVLVPVEKTLRTDVNTCDQFIDKTGPLVLTVSAFAELAKLTAQDMGQFQVLLPAMRKFREAAEGCLAARRSPENPLPAQVLIAGVVHFENVLK